MLPLFSGRLLHFHQIVQEVVFEPLRYTGWLHPSDVSAPLLLLLLETPPHHSGATREIILQCPRSL